MTTTAPASVTGTGRQPFDVHAALPTGTTVLEASAGTGKTYTIAALTARYLAEGVAELGDLMLVTFGRNASLELRLRVRERLVAVEAALRSALDATAPAPVEPDEVTRLICSAGPQQLQDRRARVARALADFDAATIATTHEFCLQMLDGLGVLGDSEPQAVFVEQLGELTREVAGDVYLRRYATSGRTPMPFEDALLVARRAVEAVHAELVPAPTAGDDEAAVSDADERVAFAHEVRAEVERRKLAGRLLSYDDMLTRLRDALADPRYGEAAATRLRQRYRVVMVDEFQDTDPVQWEILRRAFHGHATMVLIGDPKQAIYAFRGADVFSYLDAVHEAGQVQTLGTNWRSDAALVGALDALMGGTALGDERIVVRPVHADHQERRLRGPDGEVPPLRLRVWPHPPDAEPPRVGTVRPTVVRDLVADITATLGGGLELRTRGDWRAVQPADIAVLVRTNERGEAIRDALVEAGVPAVMLGASSVFTSPMAQEWLTLLTALEQPRQQLARRAALTAFVGWNFSRLAESSDDQLTELAQRVRGWSRVLAGRGVAALLETMTRETQLPERLLGTVGGERQLTDLRHLAESLHAAMVAGPLGVGALREWLRQRIEEAQARLVGDGTRRLETDARAVTVVTVHRSKGLEYPLVYLPDPWDRHVEGRDEGRTLQLHVDGTSVLDVGGRAGEGRAARFGAAQEEDAGENLRLLYVALTRAQCQVVAWWAPSHNTASSALQRFLYRPLGDVVVPESSYPVTGDPFSARTLGGGILLESLEPRALTTWQPEVSAPPRMSARAFGRELDLQWRRTSYSSLTAAAHGLDLGVPSVGSEAEPVYEDDEVPVPVGVGVEELSHPTTPGMDTPSPMGGLPSGVDFGTAVHTVYELVDWMSTDLPAEVRRACAVAMSRAGSGLSVDDLAAALLPSFATPLGPLAEDRRLSDIAPRDRLAELTFELPLAGGDVTTAEVRLGDVVPLLRRHLRPPDPLTRYADLLDHPALAEQPLRGYLNGSIDAVLRVGEADRPRYLVVDYKTNWLGGFDGRTLTVGDYQPSLLAEAMMAAHYPLQALLYSVAVHRLLRWRQPGYDPEVHLGGVLYLFVRGMAGVDTPRVDGVPCGVFSWRPPAALVAQLSDLLDGSTGSVAEVGRP